MSNPKEFPPKHRRSRLFPILGDNLKEGRATSVLLTSLEVVDEFRNKLLSKLGVNKIHRHNISTYTEVDFPKSNESKNMRPDGLISVERGKFNWQAIIEAKIGKNELYADQIENYLKLAKLHEIDSVITISNQFTTLPDHHPVSVSKGLIKKVNLHHWSWMYILTEARILIDNEKISNPEQCYILKELVRFLTDDNMVVNGFEQMPEAWKEVASKTKHGNFFRPSDKKIQEVVGAWHQEGRDISLILSRELGQTVPLKIARKHMSNNNLRTSDDAKLLCDKGVLQHIFEIKNAASNVFVSADLKASTIIVAMKLEAPRRATIKGQVNWLLNQLRQSKNPIIRVKFDWKGQYPPDSISLNELIHDRDQVLSILPKAELREFAIEAIVMDANKIMNRKSFISTLESTVIEFYDDVGQHLMAWQPAAPKPIKKVALPIDPEINEINKNESESEISVEENR